LWIKAPYLWITPIFRGKLLPFEGDLQNNPSRTVDKYRLTECFCHPSWREITA